MTSPLRERRSTSMTELPMRREQQPPESRPRRPAGSGDGAVLTSESAACSSRACACFSLRAACSAICSADIVPSDPVPCTLILRACSSVESTASRKSRRSPVTCQARTAWDPGLVSMRVRWDPGLVSMRVTAGPRAGGFFTTGLVSMRVTAGLVGSSTPSL